MSRIKFVHLWLFVLFSVFCVVCSYGNGMGRNKFNITSLMNAVEQDDYVAVKVLIKSGMNPSEKNIAGVSALHIASKYDCLKSAEVLVEFKADLNTTDQEGFTPLMRACLNRNYKIVELLAKNKANLWKKNIFGDTALVHASMSDCFECVEIIKKYTNKNDVEISSAVGEINKSLDIVYRKENTNIEKSLNEIYYEKLAMKNKKEDAAKMEKLRKEEEKIRSRENELLREIAKNNDKYNSVKTSGKNSTTEVSDIKGRAKNLDEEKYTATADSSKVGSASGKNVKYSKEELEMKKQVQTTYIFNWQKKKIGYYEKFINEMNSKKNAKTK